MSGSMIACCITVVRMILAPFAAYAWYTHRLDCALGLSLGAATTDFLDGFVARQFNGVTQLGSILDPVADKLFVGMSYGAMVIAGDYAICVPGFMCAYVVRELCVVAGSMWALWRDGTVSMRPTMIGKATTALHLCCLTASALCASGSWALCSLWTATAAGMTISAIEYVWIDLRKRVSCA